MHEYAAADPWSEEQLESEDDAGIYGIFDNREVADFYAEEVNHMSSTGMKYAEFAVRWRLTGRATHMD